MVRDGLSTRKIAELSGKSQTNARYWLGKHGLSTSGKRGRPKKKCRCGEEISKAARLCTPCHQEDVRKKAELRYAAWKSGNLSVLDTQSATKGLITSSLRGLLFEDRGNCCEQCGWTYWPENMAYPKLTIDHINNDYRDNRVENLMVLCPNCHSIKSHESPVNRGSGRRSNGDHPEQYN